MPGRPAATAVPALLLLCACSKAPERTLAAIDGPPPTAEQSTQTGDGYIPEGQSISPFDDANPAISRLNPKLRSAMQQAATAAYRQGVNFRIDSGWRSAGYQQQLLNRAIATYGNEQTARRYVSTPEKSAHVRGAAVDVGPPSADGWLSQHGYDFGLCQTYANEDWHFELSSAPGGRCPPMVADASAG